MKKDKPEWKLKIKKVDAMMFLSIIVLFICMASYASSLPAAPIVNYISNTTYTSGSVNRSMDAKGTITTVTLSATQQDYKWKAYVGNVSGKMALADASGTAIYDWNTGTPTGEVYVSRYSSISWGNIACANQASIDAEENNISMSLSSADNLNATFNYTTHLPFNVGTTAINGCRSTATYRNGTAQAMGSGATFQEVLLRDTTNSRLVYTTLINASSSGFNNQNYDFQLIVGENESSSTPSTYYFWVELG